MKFKSLKLAGTIEGKTSLLSMTNRPNMPGLTGIIITDVEPEKLMLPTIEECRDSEIYLVEFKETGTSRKLYLTVKSRYEVPYNHEVVTEDFIHFISTNIFNEISTFSTKNISKGTEYNLEHMVELWDKRRETIRDNRRQSKVIPFNMFGQGIHSMGRVKLNIKETNKAIQLDKHKVDSTEKTTRSKVVPAHFRASAEEICKILFEAEIPDDVAKSVMKFVTEYKDIEYGFGKVRPYSSATGRLQSTDPNFKEFLECEIKEISDGKAKLEFRKYGFFEYYVDAGKLPHGYGVGDTVYLVYTSGTDDIEKVAQNIDEIL